jgi:predicted ester cyclase
MDAKSEAQARISPEWMRDWVKRFVAGWNSHDPDRLLSLATDDVTWVDPFIPGGVAEGKAAVSEWLISTWTAFPDLRFEIVGEPFVSLDGAHAAAAWRGTATFTGPHRAGIEPTGARIELTGIDVHEFAGDLVCRVVTETDTMRFLVQIGAVPAPGA